MALSDSNGGSVQSYEYSVYGQVAAEDPNFIANSYMFTGRRFDFETGLYCYRARYYNPYIGRFLQTDPVGYGEGMNLYAYCGNNPLALSDPSGLSSIADCCDLILPTGHFMALPYRVNPSMITNCDEISNAMDAAGTGFGLIGYLVPGVGQIPTKTIGAYIKGCSDVVGSLPGIAAINKNLWRAFIEVQA